MPKRARVPPPFEYRAKPHRRVHGPCGHADYQAYKPWLRDEFEFRCVYCLTRERWSSFGHTIFSIDHVKPKSRFGELTTEYDNLVYCCMRCNGLKAAQGGLPDPCKDSLARHLKQRSGRFIARTPQGKRLLAYLRLNEDQRVESRQLTLLMFDAQARRSRKELVLTFGYPIDLPDLTRQKPPKGNRRPAGLQQSHYERRKTKKLPDYY